MRGIGGWLPDTHFLARSPGILVPTAPRAEGGFRCIPEGWLYHHRPREPNLGGSRRL